MSVVEFSGLRSPNHLTDHVWKRYTAMDTFAAGDRCRGESGETPRIEATELSRISQTRTWDGNIFHSIRVSDSHVRVLFDYIFTLLLFECTREAFQGTCAPDVYPGGHCCQQEGSSWTEPLIQFSLLCACRLYYKCF